MPSKTQTYIAAKKPILAIIKGDTAEIIRDNNLGLCVDPSNINDITKVFKRCVDMSDDERKKFTHENDRLLTTTFNKEKTIEKLLKIVAQKIY